MLTMNKSMLTGFAFLAVAACDNPKTDTTTTTSAPTPVTPVTQPATNIDTTPKVAPVPVAAPNPIANAKNAADVTVFTDQVAVPQTSATILSPAATIRTAPQGSTQVLVGKQGLAVTEVARHKGYYLVTFNDPSDATVQKAGWVYHDALESSATAPRDANGKTMPIMKNPENAKGAPASAAAAKLTCPAGQSRFQSSDAFCANSCKADSDCKNVDGVCDGFSSTISQSGQLTPGHYCVTNSVPGSTPTTRMP